MFKPMAGMGDDELWGSNISGEGARGAAIAQASGFGEKSASCRKFYSYKSLLGVVMAPSQGGMVAKLPWNSLWRHVQITTLAARVSSDSSAPAGCGKGFKKKGSQKRFSLMLGTLGLVSVLRQWRRL